MDWLIIFKKWILSAGQALKLAEKYRWLREFSHFEDVNIRELRFYSHVPSEEPYAQRGVMRPDRKCEEGEAESDPRRR